MVVVTLIAAVIAVSLMTVDRQKTLTGYDVEFSLRDEGSTFEIASLTKDQAEKVDAKIENYFIDNKEVFVLQDSKGIQYVSRSKLHNNGSISQSFEGSLSWGKYIIIEVSRVDIKLTSTNPLKVTVNYSTRDRLNEVWFWLICVALLWLYGMWISIFE